MTTREIRVYCTPFCPDCRRARAWLDEHRIEYLEIDVTTSLDLRERVAALNNGDLHTPTFDIDGEIVVDFQEERLASLLGVSG